MKKALIVLGGLGILALVLYLGVMNHLSGQRADRLQRALMEAEARVLDLEADIQIANDRITELARAGKPSPGTDGSSPAPATNAAPGVPAEAAGGGLLRYAAAGGVGLTNLVRIEGTSSVHDWQVEGHLLGGTAEFPPGFTKVSGTQPNRVPLEARANVFIPVRSLKSIHPDGRPYSDPMDEIMYGKLLAEEHKRLIFTLTSLALTNSPRESGGPVEYEAKGSLLVAGQTNTVTLPVSMVPASDGKLQFTGSVKVKMTDFNITPPAPSAAGVVIRTGDEVTLRFSWWVKPVAGANATK
jgi:hypothetical protein